MTTPKNVYSAIIEEIFKRHHKKGLREFIFQREEIVETAAHLGIRLPKNLGDLIYSFRYRAALPAAIVEKAPPGEHWVIRPAGRGKYRFALSTQARILPNPALAAIKILDATPGMIERYALSDEQALLAKLHYNRLLDIFSGITCYSLQNHMRTTVTGIGQVEVDEIYVGVDRHGAQYVFPVQAKGGRDQINVVQIEQDIAVCAKQFLGLHCRPIAAQFLADEVIALFELVLSEGQIAVLTERHFRLVCSDDLSDDELLSYQATRRDE
jgi:hypothetical protein